MKTYLALTFLSLVATGHFTFAEESPKLAQLIASYEKTRNTDHADLEARTETLESQFRQALLRLGTQYREAGNLEGQTAVMNEISALDRGEAGESSLEKLAQLRSVFLASSEKLKAEEARYHQSVDARFGPLFEKLKEELVKDGEIESAVKASEIAIRLQANSAGASPAPDSPRKESSMETEIVDSEIYTTEMIAGTHELDPGIYRFEDQIKLGQGKTKDREKHEGHLIAGPGVHFEDIKLLIDEGSLSAESSRFIGGKIMIDLGGSITATDSVFDQTALAKGGAWSVRWFSAKWTLTNCVLNQTFISPMRNRSNGVSLKDCTIIGASLTANEYYEDPVEESEHEWRTIERCHFINCEIPESVLLATKDCLFENCRFVPDIDKIKPEKSATVTIFVTGADTKSPAGNDRVTFKIEDERFMKKSAGATLKFELIDDKITLY